MDRKDAGEQDKQRRITAHVGYGIMEFIEVQSKVGATRGWGRDEGDRGGYVWTSIRSICSDAPWYSGMHTLDDVPYISK